MSGGKSKLVYSKELITARNSIIVPERTAPLRRAPIEERNVIQTPVVDKKVVVGAPWWRAATVPYQRPKVLRSLGQLANSLVPYLILWYLMYRSLSVSYLLTLLLAVPTGGFMVRCFIIFHDCGHGAFFKARMGQRPGRMRHRHRDLHPLSPVAHDHAIHHATAGDLDRRGVGDVWTLTVKEYQRLAAWRTHGLPYLCATRC